MTCRYTMLAIVATLVAGGCAVGSKQPPSASVSAPDSFIEARAGSAAPSPIPDEWWQLFADPALDAHVKRALGANTDLRIAIANLEVSQASLRQSWAAQSPATVVESGAGPERADRQPSTSSVPKTSYEIATTIAYEVDLFGRLRSASAAAKADSEAGIAARDAARVMVIADTVTSYIGVCGATAGARIARVQVTAQGRSVELVTSQLSQGEVSPLEQSQARTALERARSVVAPLEADRRRALFVLATLQGMQPEDADSLNVACSEPPRIRSELPVGESAALIARRPDIREAERKLAAATARIGVATADLYPRISLGGSAGRIGGEFDSILTPLITWSFPNQSVARAKIAAAKGAEAAALAAWDAAILRGLREVETVLADYRAESERRVALEAAMKESSDATRRAQARYRLGADSYLLVLDAERSRNEVESQRVASDTRLALLQVALFRALGVGWQNTASGSTATARIGALQGGQCYKTHQCESW
jgi:NodT family efflux transporter outer membrane factor (OMF) lipoprotein